MRRHVYKNLKVFLNDIDKISNIMVVQLPKNEIEVTGYWESKSFGNKAISKGIKTNEISPRIVVDKIVVKPAQTPIKQEQPPIPMPELAPVEDDINEEVMRDAVDQATIGSPNKPATSDEVKKRVDQLVKNPAEIKKILNINSIKNPKVLRICPMCNGEGAEGEPCIVCGRKRPEGWKYTG